MDRKSVRVPAFQVRAGFKPLVVPLVDLVRATLSEAAGNIGFLGLAPDGSAHHVVAPVDLQIARGVKAGNRPLDGPPFGGYAGWRYFACPPYEPRPDPAADRAARLGQARRSARLLVAWAAGLGLDLVVSEAKPR